MNPKKFRIGITLRVENFEKYNEKRDAISHEWVNFIEKMNMIPIFIPNTLKNIQEFLEELQLEGIILSGGDNIGEEPSRDRTEQILIEFGISKKIPILGICRGMQVLNNFFGGTHKITNGNQHVSTNHEILITDEAIIKDLKSNKILVNSYHHNIISEEDLGNNLKVFALSSIDNTVEGFLHNKFPITGIMWHPERDKKSELEIKLMRIFYGE